MDKELYALVPFWICILIFLIKEGRLVKNNSYNNKNSKYAYATLVALGIGVFIRSFYLQFPFFFLADEAMAGYDAWCLAHYGVDQHLAHWPIYLKSWGSGQNALYSYLAIPFVKILGLTIPVFRLPMAIWSCISILFFYYAFRKTQKNNLLTFIITAVLVIAPWHISKSRFSLECNITPDFLLIAVSCVLLASYETSNIKRSIFYALSSIFMGFSAYGYAVVWFMLPFFCILTFGYLYRIKSINIKQIALSFSIIGIIVFPLILFLTQLLSGGDGMTLGPFTITTLSESRHNATSIFGAENPLQFFKASIYSMIHMFLYGYDYFAENSLPYFAHYYNPIGNMFIIYALVKLIKKENRIFPDYIMFIWLISNILIIFSVSVGTNHFTTIWISLIYFLGRGIYFFVIKNKIFEIATYTIFVIAFALFCQAYFKKFWYPAFYTKDVEMIKDLDRKKYKAIYVYKGILRSNVQFLNPISPYVYNKTKLLENPGAAMEDISQYSNYQFRYYDKITPRKNCAYLLPKYVYQYMGIDTAAFNVNTGTKYMTIITK